MNNKLYGENTSSSHENHDLPSQRFTTPKGSYYTENDGQLLGTNSSISKINADMNSLEEKDIALEPNVFDVAQYIIENVKPLTPMKLHKLLYYCQAWSLVWDEKPLFEDKIEAWVHGPVVPILFSFHRGAFNMPEIPFANTSLLSKERIESINSVINFYGKKSPSYLVELTHNETPWQEARKGLSPMERGSQVITNESMYRYYSNLK